MATENSIIFNESRAALSGKWGTAILTFIVYFLVSMAAGLIPFGGLVIGGPLALGMAIFALNVVRGREVAVGDIFRGFDNFGNALLTFFLMGLFIFLWALLLIIPGIIAAYSYAMSMYILADNPTLDGMEALRRSKKMMDGYKIKLFTLDLRFFALTILSLFTFGIGMLWVWPWAAAARAKFYEDLKASASSGEIMTEINNIQ